VLRFNRSCLSLPPLLPLTKPEAVARKLPALLLLLPLLFFAALSSASD
jgi:hypothetical protein